STSAASTTPPACAPSSCGAARSRPPSAPLSAPLLHRRRCTYKPLCEDRCEQEENSPLGGGWRRRERRLWGYRVDLLPDFQHQGHGRPLAFDREGQVGPRHKRHLAVGVVTHVRVEANGLAAVKI